MSDANKRADNDPSMDDILASIRKIISDDEARAQVAANQPGQNQGPSSQGTSGQGSSGQGTVGQISPADVQPSQPAPAVPPRPPRANVNANREDVLLLTDLIEEQEPKLGAAGPRPTAPAQPIPLPRIDPVRASEMPQPSVEPAPDTASPLVGAVVAGVTSSAFDRLSQVVKERVPEPIAAEPGPNLGGGGKTIEEVVKEMLRPMLKEWLDKNLQPMVERMVEREIVRLTRR
jgi:cell pole-organizing protein PopZ